MARRLLRHVLTIGTPVVLTAGMFFGLGLWRHSQDVDWCSRATAGGVVSEGAATTSFDLLQDVRSACTLQRERQRVMLGAVWRTGGQKAAQCGFELARLQLVSDRDQTTKDAVLQRYGISDPQFEASDRASQDRFVQACLAADRAE